jgi:hypothetical protein
MVGHNKVIRRDFGEALRRLSSTRKGFAVTTMEMQVEKAHHQAVDASVEEVADALQSLLSRRLVAYIAGVKEAKTVSRWANGETVARSDEVVRRLQDAYHIALLLMEFDSPRIVKAWFIGLNPHLADTSPVEAIREGRTKEALAAARAFIVGG